MCTLRLALDLSSGRPVCSYDLNDQAFASVIRSIVQGVADGSIAYADWAVPDGHFRIRRKLEGAIAGTPSNSERTIFA
jgi:hypothetical protein